MEPVDREAFEEGRNLLFHLIAEQIVKNYLVEWAEHNKEKEQCEP